MCSLVVVYSQEAQNEIKDLINSRNYYVGTDGRISFSNATDTVNYLLKNMTGNPRVPGMENYREGESSTFTHNGKNYSIDKLLQEIEKAHLKPKTFQVSELEWVLQFDQPDPDRVKRADTSTPGIVAYHDNKPVLVDGLHRLTKAKQENERTLTAYVVTDKMLEKASVTN